MKGHASTERTDVSRVVHTVVTHMQQCRTETVGQGVKARLSGAVDAVDAVRTP